MKQLLNNLKSASREFNKYYNRVDKDSSTLRLAANLAVMGSVCLIANEALATGIFDIDKAISGTVVPVETAVDKWWSRILGLSAGIGFLVGGAIGQDGKSRAIGTGVALIIGAGLMVGIKAGTT